MNRPLRLPAMLSQIPKLPTSIPEVIQRPPVPMPRSLFYLSISSSVAAFILLPLSLLDLGILSFYVNPPVTVFTILYHGFVLFVSQRPRKAHHPTYYATIVLFAFVLTIGWLIAFISSLVVFTVHRHGIYDVERLANDGLPATVHSQRLQVLLTFTELLLTGGMAIKGFMIAAEEGEPDSWRPEGLKAAQDEERNKPETPR
ncbi:hypothetical protein C8J56DRAFT_933918 [Mycena floridula]|nr:hypothetical protein C8J56DRAFT_933918 [Mycena floridula]